MLEQLTAEDPRTAGRYRLEGRLGSGAMGQVFLGRDPGGQLAAVKVIHPELADDPGFRARFAREVAAARTVGGRFTAPLVDADPDGPQPWLATAYVDGPSLADAVATGGPLPADSVLALAAGLAGALVDIHAAGVVHRDLKPSNVLLAEDGPRVIDFGIASAADASTLTQSGLVMGSPGFMSPEQAEGHPAGPASDVFSLGAVLVFAATGAGPFGAGPGAALVYRVVHAEPQTGHLPAELRSLVERCLAKNPQDRPGAGQILAELTAAARARPPAPSALQTTWTRVPARQVQDTQDPAAGLPTRTAVPVRGLPGTPGMAPRADQSPRRRPRLLWAAGGLITACVIGVSALAIWHAHVPPNHEPRLASTRTAGKLPPPVLISPVSGAVFSHHPRYTVLSWHAVPGAEDYFVQVQYCQPGGCRHTGSTGPADFLTVTVNGTHFGFDFVSDQPGRWRVAAIGPNGEQGQPSPWWGFRYTR